MKRSVLVLVLVVGFGFAGSSHAALIDRGGGLIYDTDYNITWLQDAGLGGLRTWNDAVNWADTLVYGGFDDWRLPTALNQDGTGPCIGFNCTGSEMGHLYYTEFGNSAGGPLANTGPFINLQPYFYWSGTEYAGLAFDFNFNIGSQNPIFKAGVNYAWAVRPGDVAAVPEPATILLLGSGLVAMVALRRKLTA